MKYYGILMKLLNKKKGNGMDYVVSSRIQSIVFLLRVNGENVCN